MSSNFRGRPLKKKTSVEVTTLVPHQKKSQKVQTSEQQGANATSSLGQDVVLSSPAEKLAAEMFYQIFRHIDYKSLINSREVCTTWRHAIDNNPKLLRLLTFTVIDIADFINSPLTSKVKSIRFIQPLEGTAKSLKAFFIKIGSRVEEVILNFGEQHVGNLKNEQPKNRRKLMFSMILRFCTKINSLTIKSELCRYNCFIKGCTEDPRNTLTLSMIQRLSVNANMCYKEDFAKLVLSLPNLLYLDLNYEAPYCYYLNERKILRDVIMEHLKKYNGKLQEISYTKYERLHDDRLITQLLFDVNKLYPNTKIKCIVNLNKLLEIQETEDIQTNEIICKGINVGSIKSNANYINEIDTSRIKLCSNLYNLDMAIYDKPQISSTKLEFIKELKKLNDLRIKDFGRKLKNEEYTILNIAEAFSFGIPSLTTLDFDGEGLGLNSILFHSCFPNLTKLSIRNHSGELKEDFIYDLTNLDQLKSLTLERIGKLTDEHLTKVYDFTEEDGKISKLPAIAGFKCLRHLYIGKCPKLTDDCLKNVLTKPELEFKLSNI